MSTDHELERINELTEQIIGCAIEVHRHLGAGLLEHTYEAAMCVEMGERGISYERQAIFPLSYKGIPLGEDRVDLILRCTGLRVGLLINFNGRVLRTGVRRFIL